ncbi:MAG: primosomal protein N' [Lachnospiraceae bacterium]|nr:primosomal protein N' [Lachnospiraceae bacterium]
MDKVFASIIVDISAESLNKPFIYVIPNELVNEIKEGDKVIIPFGVNNKDKEGYVLEILDFEQLKEKKFYQNDEYFKKNDFVDKLKVIKSLATKKIAVKQILFKIAIFLCREYSAPIQNCIKTVLPVKRIVRKNKKQVDAISKYNINDDDKKTREDIVLNDEQNKIIKSVLINYKKGTFSEHLIYGVTGSGKTEVYLKIIEEVIKDGKQVIVLIPEIALTHQTVIRLKEKFSENIAIIHSRMSEGDKYIQYKKCEDGKTSILVGPRSAIFAPFDNLGLVVMDEVNDSSYKSETIPRYNTIDVARFRCKEQNATLITLSATPNIDLYYEANRKDNDISLYKLTKRASSTLPEVLIVDMKEEVKSGNKSVFSKVLIEKINDRLDKKEQVMLYMNRRGYNTIFTCKNCGNTYKCPHCDVALVSHSDGMLKCHYCGYEIREPMLCPICKSSEIEKYGMGTEKLEEMCIDLFPNAKVLRMDRDTTSVKDGHDKIIEKFRNGKADILIGTQMIVKGHDFPNVTLVAIMRADLSLYTESYKASEDTFALLTQCVGRSGRKISGESIIQCYDSDSFVYDLVKEQNYEKFYNEELKQRKKLSYPPFSKLLNIRVGANNEAYLSTFMQNLKVVLDNKNDTNAKILGPTKTNPEKVKDIHFKKIIVKCSSIDEAKKYRTISKKFKEYSDKRNLLKIIFDIE